MRTRAEARRERARRARKDLEQWQIEVPNDATNEQVLLAAMAADRGVRRRLLKRFHADHFFAEKHKAIFSGLRELEEKGLEFDLAVLQRLAPDVDIRYLEQLAEAGEVPPNLDHKIDMLAWDNKRAEVTEGPFASLFKALQNPRETPDRVRALARLVGKSFEDVDSRAPFLRDPKEVVREMMKNLRSRVAGEAHYPVGIRGLDFNDKGEKRLRPGTAPGLTTIITGMSGAGKTTLAAHVIRGQVRAGRRVLVGAWEVRAPMTLELITTLDLGWSRSRVLDGKTHDLREDLVMSEEELLQFEERALELSPWITFVENPFRRGSVTSSGKVTNDDYLDILEQHVEASGCDVALFDLFDRCLRHRRPDDEQEALWRLLEMTDAHQIHSIIVHQQLIKGEGVRKDRKPSLEGLKGSSAYVDAGAAIIAPHIPARWKNVPDDKFQIFGLKQRFAPPFAVEFDWNPDTGQIWGGRDMGLDEALWEDGAEHEGARDGRNIPKGVTPPRKRR